MTDIVLRLREGRTDGTPLRWTVTDIHREAADEIERLRDKEVRMKAALSEAIENIADRFGIDAENRIDAALLTKMRALIAG